MQKTLKLFLGVVLLMSMYLSNANAITVTNELGEDAQIQLLIHDSQNNKVFFDKWEETRSIVRFNILPQTQWDMKEYLKQPGKKISVNLAANFGNKNKACVDVFTLNVGDDIHRLLGAWLSIGLTGCSVR